MIDLALSVLFSSLIFVIFKLYDVYHIDTLHAIIVNYFIACTVGLLFYRDVSFAELSQKSWLPGAIALGILFIVVFNLMARTSQRLGVSVASGATKMSLVIPVVVGVLLYSDSLGALKIMGIVLALAAVYFASLRDSRLEYNKINLILPALVFLGSGIIDSSIKYLQENYVPAEEFPLFSAAVFAAAAIAGSVFILIKSTKGPIRWSSRDVVGGIALGIPNFFSIYFLLRALANNNLNSASIFTINNVAIVMFSTLLGILLFREKLSKKNWAGIAMAVVSILMVALY